MECIYITIWYSLLLRNTTVKENPYHYAEKQICNFVQMKASMELR